MASLFEQYQPREDDRTGTVFDPKNAINPAPVAPIGQPGGSISQQALEALRAQKARTGTIDTSAEAAPDSGGGGFSLPGLARAGNIAQGAVSGGPLGVAGAIVANEIVEGINPFDSDIKGKVTPETQVLMAQRRGATTLAELGDIFDVGESPDYQNLMLQYDAAAKLFGDQGDLPGFQAYAQQFTAQLPSLLGQIKTQEDAKRAAAQQERERTSRIIQMQNQFAPIFENLIGASQQSNEMAYTAAVDAADQLKASNPTLAALITSSAANQKTSSDALLAAYSAQIKMAPANYQEIQQQQIASQYMAGMAGA